MFHDIAVLSTKRVPITGNKSLYGGSPSQVRNPYMELKQFSFSPFFYYYHIFSSIYFFSPFPPDLCLRKQIMATRK